MKALSEGGFQVGVLAKLYQPFGIEGSESPIKNLHREMQEEIGIVYIKVIGDSGKFISYLWLADVFPDSKLMGQEHIYLLINGANLDIKKLTATKEFSRFAWFTLEENLNEFIELKKPAYQQAFEILG